MLCQGCETEIEAGSTLFLCCTPGCMYQMCLSCANAQAKTRCSQESQRGAASSALAAPKHEQGFVTKHDGDQHALPMIRKRKRSEPATDEDLAVPHAACDGGGAASSAPAILLALAAPAAGGSREPTVLQEAPVVVASPRSKDEAPRRKKSRAETPLDKYFECANQGTQQRWIGPADMSVQAIRRAAPAASSEVQCPALATSFKVQPTGKRKYASRATKTTFYCGRKSGTKELVLKDKYSAIRWAINNGLIMFDGIYRMAVRQCVDMSWMENAPRFKIAIILKWANQSLKENWEGFEKNSKMQSIFGLSPLSQCSRIPDVWFSATSVAKQRRGRIAFSKKYPQLAALKAKLVDLHNESRDQSAGKSPKSPSQEWIYNTWQTVTLKNKCTLPDIIRIWQKNIFQKMKSLLLAY